MLLAVGRVGSLLGFVVLCLAFDFNLSHTNCVFVFCERFSFVFEEKERKRKKKK